MAFQQAIAAHPGPYPEALAGNAKALLFSGAPITRTIAAFEAARPQVTDDWAFWSLCIRCYLTVYSECLTRLPSATANRDNYHIGWLYREACKEISLGAGRFESLSACGRSAEVATAARTMTELAAWLQDLQDGHPLCADLHTPDFTSLRVSLWSAARNSHIDERPSDPDHRELGNDVLTRSSLIDQATTAPHDLPVAGGGLLGKMLLTRALDRLGRGLGLASISKGTALKR